MTKIVDAVDVSGIVAIGVGIQFGFQAQVPIRWIGQAHFDFESERIEIVIIARAGNGKRDGLDTHQGGLKFHFPGYFVPVIHIGYVKQAERHAADCSRRSSSSPFYSSSGLVKICDVKSKRKELIGKIDLYTFFQPAEWVTSFHAFHHVLQGLSFWVSRREPQGILMHAGRLAKNGTPFHLFAV